MIKICGRSFLKEFVCNKVEHFQASILLTLNFPTFTFRGDRSPILFWKSKKLSWFWKKGPGCIIYVLKTWMRKNTSNLKMKNLKPLTGAQLRRRGEASPALFRKSKKKCPNFIYLCVKISIQNVVFIAFIVFLKCTYSTKPSLIWNISGCAIVWKSYYTPIKHIFWKKISDRWVP